VLILGGARSGKSAIAERIAREKGGRVTFVATAEAHDEEMRQRILAHQAARPDTWRTVEEPIELGRVVSDAAVESDMVVVDCLSRWVSNHLCRIEPPASDGEWTSVAARLTPILEREVAGIIEAARTSNATLLVVSNEVGLGLVPDNPLGRIYRDLLGFVNRWLAAAADQVLLMVAGLPLDVKQLALGELP
jgi:adenosylcobinamide kinase/adenosylcobinamide-phosphate guanylyltransferase